MVFTQIATHDGQAMNIDPAGNLFVGDSKYDVVYKATPRPDWVRLPWISPSIQYRGAHAIGMEIQAHSPDDPRQVDKVNLKISGGHDTYALRFGNTRYTGFALMLPKATFEAPENDKRILLAQWWQGAPYGPPVRLGITGSNMPGTVHYQFWVLNDDTLGNPSAQPQVAGEGDIPLDAWNRFEVMITPDFAGNGEIAVWLDDKKVVQWRGKVGYTPSAKPYKGANGNTPSPNKAFDVYIGPYRETQARRHQAFYANIRFADTADDARP